MHLISKICSGQNVSEKIPECVVLKLSIAVEDSRPKIINA